MLMDGIAVESWQSGSSTCT